MPFGIQPIHIVIIIVVALLIFGPKRLPEMGRSIGKAINEFRNGTKEMTDSLREEVNAAGNPAPANNAQTIRPYTPVVTGAVPVTASGAAIAGNFCTNCGSANVAGARFCNQCGAPLPEKVAGPSNPSETVQSN